MFTFFVVMYALCILLLLATLWLGFFRNNAVFNFRVGLLNQMLVDIDNGESVGDRLDAFKTVDYGTMVWKFWKPLDVKTWYPGTALDKE